MPFQTYDEAVDAFIRAGLADDNAGAIEAGAYVLKGFLNTQARIMAAQEAQAEALARIAMELNALVVLSRPGEH